MTSLIRIAIEEDYAAGDITSELAISGNRLGSSDIIAKEKLLFCGGPLIKQIICQFGFDIECKLKVEEGDQLKAGQVIAELKGPLKSLLGVERTTLNFLQKLSGVATHTSRIVKEAKSIVVLDTRKTTPGWRVLEKYAVQVGGARNHRFSLGDMILVKNNHIDANHGKLSNFMQKLLAQKPAYMPVEIEVRNLAELKQAMEYAPQIIMFDNFKNSEIKAGIKLLKQAGSNALLEISGGITSARFAALRALGVKYVSMGSLSLGAPALDISMRTSALKGK